MADLTEGWKQSEVDTLKQQITDTFNALASKSDILKEIEETVLNTWKGPDAEKYLDELYAKLNSLVEEVSSSYNKMMDSIDEVTAQWRTFQESNTV